MEKITNYKDLRIWQKGMDIVQDIHNVTESFPKSEFYGLASQMRRCAVSIPSNIAEGFVRQYNKEYKQFLYVAFGSCAELETQLNIAKRLKYSTSDNVDKILDELIYLSKMIMTLIKRF
jgi:four helix bundle protein